jgi:hypothetical protein
MVHGSTAPTAPVVVTAVDVSRLRLDYTRETGLQPTPADEAALVEKTIEEELLFREALARGLDRNDRSVRNWLVEQMRVLADGTSDDLYARARALGLDQTDLVVRRILVQKMRLLASRTGERQPSDAELEAFYAEHRDEYRPPDRVSFWHVFARRGTDPEALVARVRGAAPEDAVREGDSFFVPAHVVAQSSSQVEKLFGAELARTVERAETRTWIGPVRSPYGRHLVWIEKRERGTPPALAAVRGQLVERWQDEQRSGRVVALLRDLEHRYPLRVESAAWKQRRTS